MHCLLNKNVQISTTTLVKFNSNKKGLLTRQR